MNKLIDFLTNDYYKTLQVIFDNQIKYKDESFCPLSQEQIADILNISRNSLGLIIKELKNKDLLVSTNKSNKKYTLTPKALYIIKKMNKI